MSSPTGAGNPSGAVPDRVAALPLTVTPQGVLARADPWEALATLARVMFSTPARFWPHAPWFGLHEFISNPRTGDDDVKDALNAAFANLGVDWARVASVVVRKGRGSDERLFTIELAGPTEADGLTVTL